MLQQQITQILKENSNDINSAKREIQKLTKQNFTIFESNGSLFVEFDDPSDMTSFDESVLLEE